MEPLSTPVLEAPVARVAPRFDRVRRWTGILSAYFTAQTTTQLLGIAAGILFIRYMSVGEFALYTLATSVVTFFAFATDLGSTSSLVHFFHRTSTEGVAFRPYVAAVLSLRWMAFLIGVVVVLIVFPATALGRGFAFSDVLLAAAAVLLTVALHIGASVGVLSLRLHDCYAQSYRAEIGGATLRLLLALVMVVTSLLRSWMGLFAAALGTALTAWLARKGPPRNIVFSPGTTAADSTSAQLDLGPYRKAVLRYLLPTLPSAAYFSIQGPLVIWLAATFGNSRNIAEVGALARLGLLVSIFAGLSSVVYLPRLARIKDDALWKLRALQFGASFVGIAGGMFAVAWVAPRSLLWILGEQYAQLGRELLLVVGAAGLTLVGGYTVGLNMVRSWNRWQGVAVGILFLGQATMVALVPLQTTAGLLIFNLLTAALGLFLQLIIFAIGTARPTWVQWR